MPHSIVGVDYIIIIYKKRKRSKTNEYFVINKKNTEMYTIQYFNNCPPHSNTL